MNFLLNLWRNLLDSIHQMNKWAFLLGIMAGCIVGSILFTYFNLPFSFQLQVMNSNAFGAFLGAIISGFTAIGIQIYEKSKKDKESFESIKKIKLQLYYKGTDLDRNFKIIEENLNEINSFNNPYDQINLIEDKNGEVVQINSPPNEVLHEYDEKVKPYRERIKKAMNNLSDDFLQIGLVNVEKLDIKTLKEVEKFKYKSFQIQKIVFNDYPHKINGLNLNNLRTIKNAINDFIKSIN